MPTTQRIPQRFPRLLALVPCLAGLAAAQGSYSVYGSGCPGTGSGLGAPNVAPAAYANQFGGSDNAIPFWPAPTRYQQLFTADQFGGAFTIAGLGLRRNDSATVEVDSALVQLEIRIGRTSRTPATMSAVFSDNFDPGTEVVVLPAGLVEFPKHPAAPATDPSAFDIVIPFKTPYPYVPGAGQNLVVQLVQDGASMPGYTYVMDAAGSASTARLYGSPASATSGTKETGYGLVMGLYALTNHALPKLWSNQTPQIGNDFPVQLAQARPFAPAVLLLGTSDASWSGLPLPHDLSPYGAPGCALLAAPSFTNVRSVKADGTAKVTYQIPLSLQLVGASFYNQWAVVDPTANAWGLAFSNGGAGSIGQ
ncbi:MAG: hypothetical protein EPO68_13245 [Planctomycetota bacterium]|nr:MAG: hypothetical protein EPO68_13245 [Planctomycetota bacterium]